MNARKILPVLAVLLLLAVTLTLTWFLGQPRQGTAGTPTHAAQEGRPARPGAINPGSSLQWPSPVAALGATRVFATPGSEKLDRQAPPTITKADPAYKRQRAARVADLTALSPGGSAQPGARAVNRRFTFDLFPGLTLTGVASKHETYPIPGGATLQTGVYTGMVEGIPGSTFILSHNEGAFSASLSGPLIGSYKIQPGPDGWYQVAEIDPAKAPGCAPNLPMPGGTISASASLSTGIGTGGAADQATPGDTRKTFTEDDIPLTPKVADPANPVIFDLMIVYTDDLRGFYGGVPGMLAIINQDVAAMNLAFENSLVGARANLVYAGEIAYEETSDFYTDLAAVSQFDGRIDQVHDLRNIYGADIVSLYILAPNQNELAGLAFLPQVDAPSLAFSVVTPRYSDDTLAHEVGHNLGCHHDVENGERGTGRFYYSHGHRFNVGPELRRTIMAYFPGERVYHFSNPNVNFQGVPTGQVVTATTGADNARTINNTVEAAALFRIGPGSVVSVPAPTGVQASDGSYPETVVVSWNPVLDALYYQVYRSPNSNSGNAVLIGQTSGPELGFEDSSVNLGVVHYYFVKAFTPVGVSGFSQGDAGRTLSPVLGNLSGVSASRGTEGSFITLDWNGVSGASYYEIWRGTNNNLSEAELVTTSLNDVQLKDYSALVGQHYWYWVRARRGAFDFSSYGGPAEGWKKVPPAVTQAPTLSAQVANNNSYIQLTWNSAPNSSRYELVRSESSNVNSGIIIYTSKYENGRAWKDFTALPGVTYYYFVRGINPGSFGPFSPGKTAKIAVASLLAPPGNFRASNGAETNRIILTWNTVPNALGYALYRNTVNDSATSVQINMVNNSTFEWSDISVEDSLLQDVTYYYWARTMNSQGALGAFSPVDTGFLKSSPPRAPMEFVASDGLYDEFVRLEWKFTNGAAKYKIYRGSNPGDVNSHIATVDAPALYYDDYSGDDGRIYYYRVRATNSKNTDGLFSNVDDGFSADLSVTPPPLAPTNLTASENQVRMVTVSWAPSFKASRYLVYRNQNANYVGATQIGITEATTFVDETAVPNVIYYYYTVAENVAGISNPSNLDFGEALPPPASELDIALDENVLTTFSIPGQVIGTFTTTPVTPASRTFSYILTAGNGDTDNGLFQITADDRLRSNFSPTAADVGTKTIRVKSTADDDPFVYVEEVFEIEIVSLGGLVPRLAADTSGMVLTWPEMAGAWFQVESNTGLDEETWEEFGAPTQERSVQIPPTSAPASYYRVRAVPAP